MLRQIEEDRVMYPGLRSMVAHGYLAAENYEEWEDFAAAVSGSEPINITDDVEYLYDLLSDAMEEGNETARELLLEFWPPEEIIEED